MSTEKEKAEGMVAAMASALKKNQELHAEIQMLRNVVRKNHQWHQDYDEHNGYCDSELCNLNTNALVGTL